VIDVGEASETAFVGGINIDRASIVPPGHPPRADGPSVHDVYLEIAGPATSDVAHNFVQRWNEASERGRPDGGWPDPGAGGDLEFPRRLAAAAGEVPVQITRTIRAGLYSDSHAAPDAQPYPIANGESSIEEQYVAAIDAARHAIYIENQFLGSPVVLERLAVAVERGVEVVIVLPGVPMPEVRDVRAKGGHAALFFAALAALGERPGFTLAALAGPDGAGGRHDVYVHAKIMLVDDVWATIGSANLITRSFHADTELNASFWHPPTVRALRAALFREHLARETAALDAATALQTFARCAREHQAGLARALDPGSYGL
jgi:phosphatidylserine/phosphatidylglycerophosphate/cardiolipin synthase-like enzyme